MNRQEPNSVLASQTDVLAGSVAVRLTEAKQGDRNREYIEIDHLLPNLKRHTIVGGAITISAQAAKFVLNLGSTVILARLLTPRDFGLVAMVTAVTGFLAIFRHAGLATPTVQREHITHAQVSNLFWINLGVSALCAIIVAALSPIMARFYHDSRITYIMLALSTAFLIGGFRVQHLALLKRQMRFKAIALIEVGSMAVGVVVGVVMALLHYRYWSLVGFSLATEVASFLLTGMVSRWKPQLPSRGSGIGPLVAFGAHQTAGSFIFSVARGCDNVLIGRFYGPACRWCLFSGSGPAHSADRTIPVADRFSFSPDLGPPPVSTRALPLNISEALRGNCDECIFLLEPTTCPRHTDNSRIVGSEVDAGGPHFRRVHT